MQGEREMAELFSTRIRKCKNRNEAAVVYATARAMLGGNGTKPWNIINRAVLDRWSMSALLYIKEKAWKQLDASSQPEERAT